MSEPKAMGLRRVLAVVMVLVVVALWAFPSDVVKLIVRHDDVLLGRYSENRFYIATLLSPILLILASIFFIRIRFDRLLLFRSLAVLLGVVIAFVVADVYLRFDRKPRYIEKKADKVVEVRESWPHKWRKKGTVKTRPPNASYGVTFADVPETDRSYPEPPPGFPTVEVSLTIDQRGFRNPPGLDQCNIVTVGDSFCEGSRVSDGQAWPVRVSEKMKTPVYNVGISGASASNYRNNFLAHGAERNPDILLCMVYEGNDLKVHADEEVNPWWKDTYDGIQESVKDSPLVDRVKDLLCDTFAPMNSDAPVPESLALSWMPVEIKAGDGSQFYAFKPKRILYLFTEEEKFSKSTGWKNAERVFVQLNDLCRERGVRLIYVYAPSKPHVIMPLIKDSIRPEAFHEFTSYKDDDIPEPEEFHRLFYELIDSQEKVFQSFCQKSGVEFISPTRKLQEHAGRGEQVYYTYDQHWSQLGHEVVADAVVEYLMRTEASAEH